MPSQIYIANFEERNDGFKASKNRVTLLPRNNTLVDAETFLVKRKRFVFYLQVHWMASIKAWVISDNCNIS